MNILYLKYALEVAKTGSIIKAAERLYMAQPNLSRAIKELESSLGITIFARTGRGMIPTPDGEKLLQYAERILMQVDEVENMFKNGEAENRRFFISVPRASYIAHALAGFSKRIDSGRKTEIVYKETNSSRTINNLLRADYKLGIIRYAANHEVFFNEMFEEKGLVSKPLTEFNYNLVMSRKHELAERETIHFPDLEPYIEIAHADPFVPSLSLTEVRKTELPESTERRIFVFERASQFELLSENPETFMWVSPMPDNLLTRYGLVQKNCPDNVKIYRDVLVYKKDYRLSELDNMFVEELTKAIDKYIKNDISVC
ncbi:MAG: LysR family transcriptional regulator [Clostridia bacterium]|nr:LysR family transcriptional regulator [Clostridia bacterium]